jgi:hypothetical protein
VVVVYSLYEMTNNLVCIIDEQDDGPKKEIWTLRKTFLTGALVEPGRVL